MGCHSSRLDWRHHCPAFYLKSAWFGMLGKPLAPTFDKSGEELARGYHELLSRLTQSPTGTTATHEDCVEQVGLIGNCGGLLDQREGRIRICKGSAGRNDGQESESRWSETFSCSNSNKSFAPLCNLWDNCLRSDPNLLFVAVRPVHFGRCGSLPVSTTMRMVTVVRKGRLLH